MTFRRFVCFEKEVELGYESEVAPALFGLGCRSGSRSGNNSISLCSQMRRKASELRREPCTKAGCKGMWRVLKENGLYSPVCKQDQETTYGAMLHYPVQIPCEVEADPDDVAFRWEFNSSSGNLELVPTYTSGTKSLVNYIPRSESDFGTLQCWGRNSVGQQRVPCLFYVVPAEKEFELSKKGRRSSIPDRGISV
ncbi:ig-like domain-containing protein [Caerostris extrusa]|uniref:Ig-like domain-containing protein n=1 Tax=Caerostris extrusa TaxID=172846 RepID=A0AAV4XTJ3_CAEEX|nr:ig-like domain-containing protein [Caerostris extrusa]